ncbi:Protein kinase domain [Popillia japonica]|uniref:[RNA-polymerase]-subunit kinase n=1 Tax=Popillia japonica TaxID=7064 RepID=A0AAW1N554_POPJA
METKLKRYEKIEFLGEGQFATVYRARDIETDTIVAVKKIKIGTESSKLDRLIRYLEVIIKDNTIILTPANIKSYMIQTLQGLEYLHLNWILHRDLKPNNLLVNANGVLKIGDFGLAKAYGSPNRINTHQVVTRWYRAPELLFGARQYSTYIDMWAVGCILAELLLRVFGNPTEENWPGLKSLSDYMEFKPFQPVPLKHIFTAAADDLLDVISKLLVLNPNKRLNCTDTLKMPYFSNKPAPTYGSKLPLPQSIRKLKEKEKPSLKRKLLESAEGGTLSKRLLF